MHAAGCYRDDESETRPSPSRQAPSFEALLGGRKGPAGGQGSHRDADLEMQRIM